MVVVGVPLFTEQQIWLIICLMLFFFCFPVISMHVYRSTYCRVLYVMHSWCVIDVIHTNSQVVLFIVVKKLLKHFCTHNLYLWYKISILQSISTR